MCCVNFLTPGSAIHSSLKLRPCVVESKILQLLDKLANNVGEGAVLRKKDQVTEDLLLFWPCDQRLVDKIVKFHKIYFIFLSLIISVNFRGFFFRSLRGQ